MMNNFNYQLVVYFWGVSRHFEVSRHFAQKKLQLEIHIDALIPTHTFITLQ